MKLKEKKAFARRFRQEDWGWLCTQTEFLNALDTGTAAEAEVVAHALLENRG